MKRILEKIYEKSPFQKKRLEAFITRCDDAYWNNANLFASHFYKYLESQDLTIDYAVDAYLKVCQDTLNEQIKFMRTGKYSCTSAQSACDSVYLNQDVMQYYMIGLLLTQFLWDAHYKIYSFFLNIISDPTINSIEQYLEIGAGHGLYVTAAVNELKAEKFEVIDLSMTSIKICKGILQFMATLKDNISIQCMDAMNIKPETKYDFVTMGEVIEHLENPRPILRKIRDILKPDGRAFLTTCANSPAIDHIYLFHNVDEIRDLLEECGFTIEKELVEASEKMSLEDLEKFKVPINYAALVKAKN